MADLSKRDGGHAEKWDIFVSHSTRLVPEDEEFLRLLHSALLRRGVRVFIDFICLGIGRPLVSDLEEAISGSRVGLLLITEQAKRSGWVEFEVDCMKQRRAAGRLKVIALCLERRFLCPPGLHAHAVIVPRDRKDASQVAEEICRALRKVERKQPVDTM